MYFWRLQFMCFLNSIFWNIAILETRTLQLRKFHVKKVCPRVYGEVLEQNHLEADWLSCLNRCRSTPSCNSYMFVEDNHACLLNNGFMEDNPSTECESYADYAEFTTEKVLPMRDPQFVCQTNGCTNIRNGLRICNDDPSTGCDITRGRLEVFHEDQWGTICDDMWRSHDVTNPTVACKMLGFSYGELLTSSEYNTGRGRIWLDNVECMGTEDTLFECHHVRWGVHNCDHHEDIGVACYHEPQSPAQ